jgi:hypothetical protein
VSNGLVVFYSADLKKIKNSKNVPTIQAKWRVESAVALYYVTQSPIMCVYFRFCLKNHIARVVAVIADAENILSLLDLEDLSRFLFLVKGFDY